MIKPKLKTNKQTLIKKQNKIQKTNKYTQPTKQKTKILETLPYFKHGKRSAGNATLVIKLTNAFR